MEYLLFALPAVFGVVSVYLATRAVKRGAKTKRAVMLQLVSFCAVFATCLIFPMVAGAADAPSATAAASASATGMGLLAAAAATGLSCIGGGIAVAAAAPAAIGATSEDPAAFGKSLIFVALGEGIALYGLLISILILNKI
ncbi:MAG TPA: hypothetical protein GX401_00475 [Clostridiales bacterium]|nr:hypothetical protein [Clostridiales bacterium]